MQNKWPDGWDMDKFGGCLFILFQILLFVGFWGGLIYVIVHFIVKYW